MLIKAALACVLLAGCSHRAIGYPDDLGDTRSDLGSTSNGPAPSFVTARYGAAVPDVSGLSCGVLLGVTVQSLASCGFQTLDGELGKGTLRMHLNSDSDRGDYRLDAGWHCNDGATDLRFAADYTDANGERYDAIDGHLEVTTIGSGISPLDGSYDLVVQSAAGASLSLSGTFNAPPCSFQ